MSLSVNPHAIWWLALNLAVVGLSGHKRKCTHTSSFEIKRDVKTSITMGANSRAAPSH
jgi:hypothetical protein